MPIDPITGMLLGGVVSGITSSIQNRQNRKLAEYAYSKNLEQWNRQNQYNDPSQQMARLKAAGLNPNLVYGTGSAVGNTSGNMAPYNSPTMQKIETPAGSDILGAFQQQSMLALQSDQAKATIKATNADIINKGLDSQLKNQLVTNKKVANSFQAEILQNSLALGSAKISETRESTQNLQEQRNLIKSTIRGKNLSNEHQKELNKLLIQEGINPNDPSWYRDLKKLSVSKILNFLIENSYLRGGTNNTPFKN